MFTRVGPRAHTQNASCPLHDARRASDPKRMHGAVDPLALRDVRNFSGSFFSLVQHVQMFFGQHVYSVPFGDVQKFMLLSRCSNSEFCHLFHHHLLNLKFLFGVAVTNG